MVLGQTGKSVRFYCGHEVDEHGLHKSQKKVEAVVNASRPDNVEQVHLFLGLVKYYHKFLPNLAIILNPLNQLLKQGKMWNWNPECEQAFTKVKELITSDMVLTHYDPKTPTTIGWHATPLRLESEPFYRILWKMAQKDR